MGFKPTMARFKFKGRLIAEKFSRFTWEERGPCPAFVCYTLTFALKLREKHGKNLSQGSRKDPEDTIPCVDMSAFRGSEKKSIPVSLLQGTGSTFG